MKVVKATGIFGGVRKASLASTGGVLELSLDSWESPIVFTVTAVDRGGTGRVVILGGAPGITGSPEVMAIRVEANAPASGDSLGAVRRLEVTRSEGGGQPDSVLELQDDTA
ncbi:MAG TPA: hypothetical protein VIL35_10065 [Vicinamibacterales bacterium]